MILPLLIKNIKDAAKLGLVILALAAMYTGVIIYMYDPKLASMLEEYQEVMPQIMDAVGMSGDTSSLIGFIHTYLYGFLLLVLPMIFTLLKIQQLLIKPMDEGGILYLITMPRSRIRVAVTQLLSVLFCLAVLIVLCVCIGIACAEGMFPGELDIKLYLKLNGALLLFHWMTASLLFLAACAAPSIRSYYIFGPGLLAFFFLANMLANMGGSLEWLRCVTIFSLFPDEAVLEGSTAAAAGGCMLLAAVTILGAMAGAACFRRKNFSI